MNETYLRIHQFIPFSKANGPGKRAVIWVQGASGHGVNVTPEVSAHSGGQVLAVEVLFERIVALHDTIEGITISGGEPLEQYAAVTAFLRRIKTETTLSTLLLTGFSRAEAEAIQQGAILSYLDVLLTDYTHHTPSHTQRVTPPHTSNAHVHFLTDRYTEEDMQAVPPAEIIITGEGNIILCGTNLPLW